MNGFKPQSSLISTKYTALFDYDKKNSDELNMIKNDQLVIMLVINSELYFGKNTRTNKTGFIKSKLVVPSDSFELKPWYFGRYTKIGAEKLLLMPENSNGAFLIRDNDYEDGSMTLSILLVTIESRCVKHYKIYKKTNGFFYLKEKVFFKNIDNLIEFYTKDAKGLCCPLGKVAYKIKKRKLINEVHHSDIFIHENSKTNYHEYKLGILIKQDCKIVIKNTNEFNMSEFLNEIEIMKEIEHRNIIRIVATSINLPKNIIICSEFMNNKTLLDFIKIEKNINKFKIIKIIRQIASAVLYLIQNDIIHRDLRCQNVFVGDNFLVKLGNFFMARKLDNVKKHYQIRSNIKENLSVRYTAQELITPNNDSVYKIYNEKTEVWSFGVLFYEILTKGELPYKNMNEHDIAVNLINHKYRLPSPIYFNDENISLLYDNVVMKCWDAQQMLRPSILQLNEIFVNYFDLLEPGYKYDKVGLDSELKNYSEMFEEVIEVNPDEIKLGVLIKGNSQTEIWKGCFRYDDLLVGVKKYNLNEQENFDSAFKKFMNETNIMKKLKHPNLIKAYGICLLDPFYLITEYMKYGSLSSFLVKTRDSFTNEELKFNFDSMISIVKDILNGMRYLSYLNIVHCDLSARNIMIGDIDVVKQKYTTKIGGFERAILLDNRQLEKKISDHEIYMTRWSAPETVKTEFNKNPFYCIKSDVYSFGMVLFEMITKGSIPFKELSNEEVYEKVFLGTYIIKKPSFEDNFCSDELYCIMKSTWNRNPTDRPSFFDLYEIFLNYFDYVERGNKENKANTVKFKTPKSNLIKQLFSLRNVKQTYHLNN